MLADAHHLPVVVYGKTDSHASEAIQPLEPLGVPPALGKVVAFAMAKKPSVRFQSGVALAEQLAQFIEPAALRAQPPAPPATLASYERTVQHKLASLPSAAATPVAQPIAPGVPQPLPQPTSIQSAASVSPLAAAAPVEVEAPAESAIGIMIGGVGRARSSAAEIMRRRRQQQKQRNLAIGLMLLVLLVAGGGAGAYFLQDQIRQQIAAVTDSAGAPKDAPLPPTTVSPPRTPASNSKTSSGKTDKWR
jgi:hypothetical protein